MHNTKSPSTPTNLCKTKLASKVQPSIPLSYCHYNKLQYLTVGSGGGLLPPLGGGGTGAGDSSAFFTA